MAGRTEAKGGKYLYGIVLEPGERHYGFTGINGAAVYTISNGRLAAVVSDVPNEKIRPERRHLAAQQAVLSGLLAKGETVLPMAFGIIASGPQAIKKILSGNQETFIKQLQRVAGKVEMGLRVSLCVKNIFEYFVNAHPELRAARDRLLGSYHTPTQEDKIELGRLFDRILNEDREHYTEQVEEVLSDYCQEIKRNKCRHEGEVMNLACLVWRQDQDRFEQGVLEAAKLFDNNFTFDYNGPWAPHNFVEKSLNL
jgi:hypothetical protein